MGATRQEILDLADFWESRGDQAEADRLRQSAKSYDSLGWPDYDVPEMNVLTRMKKIMKEKHGYTDEDFEGATFMDIESMFLDDCGEEDFR
jgi:hypothetical protein